MGERNKFSNAAGVSLSNGGVAAGGGRRSAGAPSPAALVELLVGRDATPAHQRPADQRVCSRRNASSLVVSMPLPGVMARRARVMDAALVVLAPRTGR